MKHVGILLALLLGANAMAQVKAGPWVSEMRENSCTILWTSEKPGMAYIELEDGTVKYETFAGRRIFHRLHSIHLENLQPGQSLKYRVCGENLTDDSNARYPKFEDVHYKDAWHTVKTFDKRNEKCHFSVFNDVHMRLDKYRALASQVDSAKTDFLFLNGDIISAGNYVLDTFVRYELEPLEKLTPGIPVLFARGNHEGRGNNLELVSSVYPNQSPAPFYYTFREGPVAFVVFDGGETGRERSLLYCGKEVYEDYLNEQIEWAQKVLFEPAFQEASVKICLLHVPMIDHPDKNDYLLQRWLNEHFVYLLNAAGINLMIGADLHEHMYCKPGTMGNRFPIIVNDDARRLDVRCENGHIQLRSFNAKGEMEVEKQL